MKLGPLKLFEKTIIGGEENPLLIRYILFRLPAFGVFLHKFCRSDYDRSLHDHPWFVSIILWPGYVEEHDQTRDGFKERVWHKPGSILLRPAEWRHRVIIGDRPSWSLVFVGRRFKKWGFFLPTGWCWWRRHNPQSNVCEEEIIHTGGGD